MAKELKANQRKEWAKLMYLKENITQQEIADQIGSSREMVARILKELVFGHYIRMENRRIVLLKMLPEHF